MIYDFVILECKILILYIKSNYREIYYTSHARLRFVLFIKQVKAGKYL